MSKNPLRVRRIDVVKQAVGEDQIEAPVRGDLVGGDVGNDELVGMAPTCTLDVRRVEVDAEIIGVTEVMSVCPWSAADIEHATSSRDIVVREERSQLSFGKRGLPCSVGQSVLHEPGVAFHSRQRS